MSRNPACKERSSITHALLRAAVPMRFVIAGCKPTKQGRHAKSTNPRAALKIGKKFHFVFFFVKSSSRNSPVHIFADLIFQKCSEPSKSTPNTTF